MLKRIKIQGYKSLSDVEVHLGHLAVLVGPNASGKSNFLDALQLLSRLATCQTLKKAFAPPHRGFSFRIFHLWRIRHRRAARTGKRVVLYRGRYSVDTHGHRKCQLPNTENDTH